MRKLDTFVRIGAGMALVLSIAAWYVQPSTHAVNKSSPPARAYYLTKTGTDGAHALSMCATGYHMASLWDIHEPAVLKYDTSLGMTFDDSGSGPPTGGVFGWIRTGSPDSQDPLAGLANCHTWTTSDPNGYGSTATPAVNWEDLTPYPTSPWRTFRFSCASTLPVWCVQD